MTLGDKIRDLRSTAGNRRGLGRPMTQREVIAAIEAEQGKSISQAYLSQLEKGARPHMTNTTRMLLARFFQVHPGYLVSDPDYDTSQPETTATDDRLDLWLIEGAERFRRDPALQKALISIARHSDTRRCLLLLAEMVEAGK
ncbi:MAG: helix-turn-helix transcriptional regulator [Bryobacteraceae bacterium]